jgi:hypothetical protein
MASLSMVVPYAKQQMNLADFPNLQRWFQAIKERPATIRAYQIAKDKEHHAVRTGKRRGKANFAFGFARNNWFPRVVTNCVLSRLPLSVAFDAPKLSYETLPDLFTQARSRARCRLKLMSI